VHSSIPSVFSLLFVSLSYDIYKGEKGEKGLLPMSSHGTGVRWPSGYWATVPGPLARLVPSVFLSWQVKGMGLVDF
jgi:hypothetical protein